MKSLHLYINERLSTNRDTIIIEPIEFDTPKGFYDAIDKYFDYIYDKFSYTLDLRNITPKKQRFQPYIFTLFNYGLAHKFKDIKHRVKVIDVTGWDVSLATDLSFMFYGFNNLEYVIGLETWDVSEVESIQSMFRECRNLKDNIFKQIKKWNTPKLAYCQELFSHCTSLENVDLSNWPFKKCTDLSKMFEECNKLTTIKFDNSNMKDIKFMQNMFQNCIQLKEVSFKNCYTDNLFNIDYMFYGCNKLEKIEGFDYILDHAKDNIIENVNKNMTKCFEDCDMLSEQYKHPKWILN